MFAPLVGFISMSWYGRSLPPKWIGPAGCISVGVSFFSTLLLFSDLLLLDPVKRIGHVLPLYNWIVSGSFQLDFAILIDPLSVFMLLIITGVGFLIHVYSIGYMEHDPNIATFFSYLNLFIFSMSLLVLAADFFFLIVGWAFVGLASYLLIGFWSEKTSAVLAARKAFVMNVIGDVGMVIAAFLIYEHFGSIAYLDVFANAAGVFSANEDGVLLITFLLLIGAFAKSAQIPLHTWLPDAMEGPTPVSALIHAATMVTAGVYLIARCHVLYELAPYTMFLVAFVGVVTAVFAGSIGMVQYDIKRVIAYSTMSQLGYMFLAVGIGAYPVAMFHLMTHAFFKALLFLGAGSVIHGMDEEQDIRKMGGLRKAMPITFATFLIGALALSGFPLTSGFFSKEEILVQSWYAEQSNFIFWGIAVFTAGMTSFYSFRLFFYTFLGTQRSPLIHPHESPNTMTIPLMVLAFFALFAGFGSGWAFHFLDPIFVDAEEYHGNSILETIGIIVALGGIGAAGVVYVTGKDRLEFAKKMLAPIYDLLLNKYYVDELYDFLIVKPMRSTSKFILDRVERLGIDYFVDLVGHWVKSTSYGLSLWQSGNIRTYAFNMMVGVFFVLLFVVFI